MKNLKIVPLVAVMLMSLPVGASATTYTWLGGGNWGDTNKWTPAGFPNVAGDVATMDVSSSTVLADADGNDASFTLSALSSPTGSRNLSINNVAGGTGKLIFDNNGATASLSAVKNSGKYLSMNVGVVLNDNLSVKSMSTASSVTFNKELSSGVDKTTGVIIASQSGVGSTQNPVDVKIAAAASYTGETRIMGSAVTGSAGATDGGEKLLIALHNALPVTTVLRVDGATTTYYPKGGTMKLNGKNQEVAGVYGTAGYAAGQITTTTGSVLTINNALDYDFSGDIGGGTAISVTKQGIGVQTLSGTNTYTGTTTVEAGTLALAGTGELRFVIRNAHVANQIGGAGAVNLNGLLRLDTSALTDASGTWNLVNVATLTASFGSTFNLAFVGGPTFSNQGGGVYTSSGGWTFATADGNLTLTAPERGTFISIR